MTEVIPAPAPARVNFPADSHKMFTYGPSKCAIILWDMVNQYDAEHGGNTAHKVIGRAFQRVQSILDVVVKSYRHDRAAQLTSQNKYVREGRTSFKEHFIYTEINAARFNLYGRFPADMINLFIAVCTEQINQRKVELEVMQRSKKTGYTTVDLLDWVKSEAVKKARLNFKIQLRKTVDRRLHY